jgi:FtsP/CotA-like multicopper oxidase with cupredoxin domain
MNRIDEEVRLGETEIWIIRNRAGMYDRPGDTTFMFAWHAI